LQLIFFPVWENPSNHFDLTGIKLYIELTKNGNSVMLNKKDHKRQRKEKMRMHAFGFWDVFRNALNNFRINGDANQAAAIALYAILSAIPLFILTIVAAGHIFSSYPQMQNDIMAAIKNPYFSENLLAQLGQIEKKKNLLGGVGILSLIWLSSMMFRSVETALNMIFRSPRKRNYFLSKLLAIAMIPLGWIIGIASIAITYIATILMKYPDYVARTIGFSLSGVSVFLLQYALPYAVSVLLFSFIYRIIPTAKIQPKVALAGSAVFALLMEIAKQFFTWYVANYTRYNVIFGSLETVVILVIWVFYVALIFLFCAEMMSSYQRRDYILLEGAILQSRGNRMKVNERLFKKFGRDYPEGSIIFSEGDKDREMFYILSGKVALEKEACQVKKTLAEMGPGEYFGEMAALIEAPRTATARALTDSNLAVISGATFYTLVRESHDVAVLMLREFSRRLKNSNTALEELTNLWIRFVVIVYFLDNDDTGVEKSLPQLATLTDKLPEEISKVINDLTELKIINVNHEGFVIIDRKRIWAMQEADELKKCIIEEKDKI